jgi:peptide/nickel transport system substrate-binding protein
MMMIVLEADRDEASHQVPEPASGGDVPSIYEDAIFGQLFRLTPSGGIEPVLASGYAVSDGGTVVTISLRQGLKFTDGTPFNAQAMIWKINRDLSTPCACSPTRCSTA